MGERSVAGNPPATLRPAERDFRVQCRRPGRMRSAMPQTRTTNRMIVRTATRADAGAVAALAAQLGHDEAEDEIGRRIEEIRAQASGEIFVAVVPPGNVVGWVQVFSLLLVELPPLAEVGGIVVDARYRRIGVGRSLMEAAELW